VTTPPDPPPPPPPDDEWPTQAGPPYVADETVVQPAYAPEPAGYAPPPEDPGTRIGKGLLLGLGAVALVAAGILAYILFKNSDDNNTTTTVVTTTAATTAGRVSVPRVVGLKENEALVRLGQAGLRPKERFQPTARASGVVVSQNPSDATDVKRGSQITIVIDSGAPSVAVPDVKGLAASAAEAKLDAAGLNSTQTTVTSNDGEPGTVVDEAPAPGAKVKKGSSVTLSIAKAAPVAVPDVVSSTQADAQAQLEKAGFKVNTATVPGPTPEGQVLAQSPAAGTKAASGSAVRINVSDATGSSGGGGSTATATTSTGSTTGSTPTTTTTATTTTAAPKTATVPDVTAQTEAAATQAFVQAGVLASIVFVPSQDLLGQVLQQAKPAGTTVQRFAHVQINVSRGPGEKADATVPDVIGKTLDDALAAINGAKLRLIYLKLPVTSRAQAGKVVQQTPLSGARAPENGQVVVYLGAFGQ